jgi:hypothetical protein
MAARKPRVETERASKHWRWWKKMVSDAEKARANTLTLTDGDELAAYHAMMDIYITSMRKEPKRPKVLANARADGK